MGNSKCLLSEGKFEMEMEMMKALALVKIKMETCFISLFSASISCPLNHHMPCHAMT
jgi:hypothetical protein